MGGLFSDFEAVRTAFDGRCSAHDVVAAMAPSRDRDAPRRPEDQQSLMAQTGIDKKQLKNWFTNARRRIWKPIPV